MQKRKLYNMSMCIIMTMITKNMNITMTMITTTIMRSMTRTAPAAAMIIITIIMQMRYLQAGAKRLFINIPKKNWIIC